MSHFQIKDKTSLFCIAILSKLLFANILLNGCHKSDLLQQSVQFSGITSLL